ncbi:MAG: amidase domain-containing protein [Clostridia bacterium]|nr:amidase domain-containing protein [Clostridia bacterium]
MKSKILVLFLTLAMIISSVPCVFAAKAYNRDAAVTYAKAHWNDGKGACADFVSDCLKAGGCTAWNTTVSGLLNELNGWGTLYTVADGTTNSKNWKLNKSACKFDVMPGDIVFFYCKTCAAAGKSGYAHTAIITGFDSSGNILCAQHNGAMNDYATIRGFGHYNKKVDNNKHQGSVISLKIFHIDAENSSTTPVTPPATVNAVTKWTLSVSGITETSATVRADVKCTPSKLSKIGLELGTSSGSMKSVASWKVGTILTYCTVKCDGTEGPKLSPGTTYYYRFYVLRTDGKYEYSAMGSFKTKSVACTTHTYDKGTVTVAATCTAAGTIVYKCTKCGATKNGTIQATGHNVQFLIGKPATCTATGLTAGSKCSVCNVILNEQTVIPKEPHSYTSETKPASCTEDGFIRYTCKCGASYDETLFAKGHSESDWIVVREPQTNVPGLQRRICIVCSAVLDTRETAPLPSYIPGDVDGNGKITAADARIALRCSVGLESLSEAELKAADADKNGKITAADARLILRASVGLESLG